MERRGEGYIKQSNPSDKACREKNWGRSDDVKVYWTAREECVQQSRGNEARRESKADHTMLVRVCVCVLCAGLEEPCKSVLKNNPKRQ
jgi:hypothetical protein